MKNLIANYLTVISSPAAAAVYFGNHVIHPRKGKYQWWMLVCQLLSKTAQSYSRDHIRTIQFEDGVAQLSHIAHSWLTTISKLFVRQYFLHDWK